MHKESDVMVNQKTGHPWPQKRKSSPRGAPQRGVAMLLTMVVMSSLLVGSVVATGMRMAELRASGSALAGKRATSCSESGLAAARDFLINNWNTRGTYLQQGLAGNPFYT